MSRIGKRTALFAGAVSLAAGIVVPTVGGGIASAGTTNYAFNAVGSDTIYCLDNSTTKAYNKAHSTTTGNKMFNSAPVLDFSYYCGTTPLKQTVAADTVHSSITYNCILKDSTLTAAIALNAIVTTLSVNPLAQALQAGKNVTVGSGTTADTFVTAAAAAQGATSISVVSQAAAHAEKVGTTVSAPDCIPGDGASGNLPPDGSSAGIAALVADNGAGNIAYARSSRGRKSSDPTNIHFWAFALDGVSWSTFPGSVAPNNLTTPDLEGIMKCTITNWDQITDIAGYTGPNTPIQLWYPQVGSGTGSFFASMFNGGNFPVSVSNGGCANYGEENAGTSITQQGSFNAAEAIYPYSASVWNAQNKANNGQTGNATLNEINGASPYSVVGAPGTSSTDAYVESNANENITGDACTDPAATGFCASRFVYHVTSDVLATNQPAYSKAIDGIVAIVPGTTQESKITGYCGNKFKSEITSNGFESLVSAITGGSFSSLDSYCREF